MYKFQCKFTTLNFLSYANLHMIEKPFKKTSPSSISICLFEPIFYFYPNHLMTYFHINTILSFVA